MPAGFCSVLLITRNDYMKNKTGGSPNAFTVFFKKLPQLLLAGFLFSAPMAACIAAFAAAAVLSGFNNILIWGLGIIPSTLFLPGLVMVIRKYAVEKNFVPVAATFFKAVKENLKPFLIHGLAIYAICACSAFAIMYYYTMAQKDIVYGYIMTIYVLFTAVLTIMLFYVPLMSVTYELKIKDIYKNSLLLVFGKILWNLLTLLMVAVVCASAFFALVFAKGAIFPVAVALVAALCPMLVCYIVISMVSKGMQENVGSFVNPANENSITDEERLAAAGANTQDEYIFINGKMVKNPNYSKSMDN